jgi:hypothetical protein
MISPLSERKTKQFYRIFLGNDIFKLYNKICSRSCFDSIKIANFLAHVFQKHIILLTIGSISRNAFNIFSLFAKLGYVWAGNEGGHK